MAHVEELALLPAAAQIAGYSGRDRRETRKFGRVEERRILVWRHQGEDMAEY